MDARVDKLLNESVVTKCKVTLACMFQGDKAQPLILSEYELAYIIEALRGIRHD